VDPRKGGRELNSKASKPLLNIVFTCRREPVLPKGGVLAATAAKGGKGRFLAVENNTVPVLPQLPATQENEGGRGLEGDTGGGAQGLQFPDRGPRARSRAN
jgi:hypothetical protein